MLTLQLLVTSHLWRSLPFAQDGGTLRRVVVEVKVGRLAQPYPALHDAVGVRAVADDKDGETTVRSVLKYTRI